MSIAAISPKPLLTIAALLGASWAVQAEPVSYNFQALVTSASHRYLIVDPGHPVWGSTLDEGASAFGFSGRAVTAGNTLSGRFSYDIVPGGNAYTSTLSYVLGGPDNQIVANLANGRSLSTTSALDATVTNGPLFPFARQDSFALSGTDMFCSSPRGACEGALLEIDLSFNPVGDAGPFASTSLPKALSLTQLPYSGGWISMEYGRFDRVTRAAFGSVDEWDRLSFQLTSLTRVAAVPEPETWAMFLGGLAAMGGVARQRRTS